MLAVTVCLFGVLVLMIAAEHIWRKRILVGDNLRKFVHILLGIFIAFWPWLIGWQAIQLISGAMLGAALLVRYVKVFKFADSLHTANYGDLFFIAAVLACSFITTSKIFFTLAILELALADGAAAIIGKKFGRKWRYQVFGHTKTVLGSMAFWFISVCILGVGLLWAHELIDYGHYAALLIFVPPLLTVLENISVRGLDNLTVPLSLLLILEAVKL
jgi:phytol kinase